MCVYIPFEKFTKAIRYRDRYRYRHRHRDRDIGCTIRRWNHMEDPGRGNPGAERNLGRRTQGRNTVREGGSRGG